MNRRQMLKAAAAGAVILGAPAIVRAQPKQLLMAGPGAQAKMFEADVIPILEKKIGIKIVFDPRPSSIWRRWARRRPPRPTRSRG